MWDVGIDSSWCLPRLYLSNSSSALAGWTQEWENIPTICRAELVLRSKHSWGKVYSEVKLFGAFSLSRPVTRVILRYGDRLRRCRAQYAHNRENSQRSCMTRLHFARVPTIVYHYRPAIPLMLLYLPRLACYRLMPVSTLRPAWPRAKK